LPGALLATATGRLRSPAPEYPMFVKDGGDGQVSAELKRPARRPKYQCR
jgi:hypothetical protein